MRKAIRKRAPVSRDLVRRQLRLRCSAATVGTAMKKAGLKYKPRPRKPVVPSAL